ncbi:MAG: hypothetical protein H7317_02965 [Pseudorhodobacter sp.]|nr:hypothetical protein [Pseudorhodobacter sp.]
MRLTSALLLLATVAFAVAPLFTPGFTGYDPGLFPVVIDRPAIQPAGYAFAIWGLIYAWLILHASVGLLRHSDDAAWARPRPALLAAVLLGSIWLAIAPNYPITATLVILLMALLAVTAFLQTTTAQRRWLLSAPIGIFAGWLTAAAAVSSGVLIAGYGWLSNTATALTLIALVVVLGIAIQSRKPAMPVYGATVTWALIGVFAANWSGNLPQVAYPAAIAALIVAAATAALRLRAVRP